MIIEMQIIEKEPRRGEIIILITVHPDHSPIGTS
jgi:hypothetical protein